MFINKTIKEFQMSDRTHNIKNQKIKILDKVEASRFGLMVRCMKVGGKIIKQMAKED